MYGFFELQGVDMTLMSKRIEDARNKARAELEARGTTRMGERQEKRARCESDEHPIQPQPEELPWRLPPDRWSKENVITAFEEELSIVLTDEQKSHTKATLLVALSHLHQLGMWGCGLTVLFPT